PQIDASRMACPTSASSARSASAPARGRPAARRASASSRRAVPTPQGTHWPHDSSPEKRAMRTRNPTRATSPSRTLTTRRPHAPPHPRPPPRPPPPREGGGRVELAGADEGPGRTAEEDRLQALAAGHAPGEAEELPQGRPEGHLVHARPGHAARDGEELRP